jgi:tRNA(fMet)-specific endonuclease VapC
VPAGPGCGELRFGALNSRRAEQNLQLVEGLIQRSTILDIGVGTADFYAEIRLELRRAGTPIPENDVWIAALCRQPDLAIATSDAHFELVDDLTVIRR